MSEKPMKEERCFVCDSTTGKAGRSDDSIYWADTGPWCEECSHTLRDEVLSDSGAIQAAADEARAEEREKWIPLFDAISAVVSQSHGVYGFHLNGDVATWDEFEIDTLIAAALRANKET